MATIGNEREHLSAVTENETKTIPRKRFQLKTRQYEMLFGFLFVAPVVLHLVIFKYIPVLYSVQLSLYRGSLLNPLKKWFGLENYWFILNNDYAIRGFVNTFIYSLMYVPAIVILGIVFALLASKKYMGVSFFRVSSYTPYVVSIVAVVQVWSWILHPEGYGIVNTFLIALGLPSLRWFYDPSTSLMSIAITQVWWTLGINILVFLAALKGIPSQLYEAASVDGAGPWSQFWSITLPLLKPAIYFVVITSTILAVRLFEPVLLLTGGGPLNSTTTVSFQIYEQAFQFARWGRASAQASIFFLIVLAITFIQYRYLPDSYDK